MTELTRQQRRKREREQLKIAQQLVESGLPMQPKAGEIVAVAILISSKLREAANNRRASEAAEITQKLVERSHAARPAAGRHIACTKGCAYCCHSFVAVTPPEAFLLADTVRRGKSAGMSVEMVRTRARPLIGVAAADRIGAKLPCPLLVEGVCSVYESRPLTCRQATSLDVGACIAEFEGRDLDVEIPISPIHLEHASNAHVAMLGAMRATGFPTEPLELAASLEVALTVPDAEARWLAGEDVFAAVPRQITRPPRVELAISRVAQSLQGLA